MPEIGKKDIWLERAQEGFSASTTYMDANYRVKIEDNIRHFQSKHKAGSKYNKAAYAGRSKLFVPKTRSSIRTNEAAAAGVFFSNQDLVSIEARNQNDLKQVVSAAINSELVNYRLTETIPWFITLIGAFQDVQVTGVVCSHQHWKYEEKEIKYQTEVMNEAGEIVKETVTEKKIVKDEPCIDLRPIENIRFHPNADWRDPIGTSPYIIDMLPMYVYEVKAMTKQTDSKTGKAKWKTVTDGDLQVAKKQTYDTTASVRDNEREDKTADGSGTISEYDIVWVHRNIMADVGGDVVFYTLSTSKLLSDPIPIEEEYPHCIDGMRPYTMGVGVIESHKVMPDSLVEISTPLQQALNENKNQRQDNVALVLNKRYIVKNGASVNLKTILNNVAGSVTLANDPVGDIRTLEFNDVTSSSYQEQDRMNADFDGLVGDFSTSSVSTNRKLNETVGGMNLLKGGANSLTEYLLMTFSETWVEPTIKQLVRMIQFYETDETVIAIAADKAKLWQKYQVGTVSDDVMKQDLQVRVSVGFGSTDTQQKLEKFIFGVTKAIEIQKMTVGLPNQPDINEIQKEIFGKIGYKDGTRFFPEQEEGNPMQAQMQQMQQALQQMQQQLQDKQADRDAKLQEIKIKEDSQNKRDAAKLHVEVFKEFNKDLPVEQVEGAMQ